MILTRPHYPRALSIVREPSDVPVHRRLGTYREGGRDMPGWTGYRAPINQQMCYLHRRRGGRHFRPSPRMLSMPFPSPQLVAARPPPATRFSPITDHCTLLTAQAYYGPLAGTTDTPRDSHAHRNPLQHLVTSTLCSGLRGSVTISVPDSVREQKCRLQILYCIPFI